MGSFAVFLTTKGLRVEEFHKAAEPPRFHHESKGRSQTKHEKRGDDDQFYSASLLENEELVENSASELVDLDPSSKIYGSINSARGDISKQYTGIAQKAHEGFQNSETGDLSKQHAGIAQEAHGFF